MILPTKHITPQRSLLGLGASLLRRIDKPKTVVGFWNEVRTEPEVATFQRFVLALDLLYILGVVTFEEGLIKRFDK